VKKFLAWLKSFFSRQQAAPTFIPSPPKRRPRVQREEVHSHYYLGDLLDSLDHVFSDFALLKKRAPDVYALNQRTGVSISSSLLFTSSQIEPWAKAKYPAFACTHIVASGDAEKNEQGRVDCSFAYVQKIDRPINVQPSNHPVYLVGGLYKAKGLPAHCSEIYVALQPDGTCRALKKLEGKYQSFGGYRGGHGVVRMQWGFPETFLLQAQRHNQTLDQYVTTLVAICLNRHFAAESGIKVRVTKGANSAVFAIDMERTPYFFADRDAVVNENGQKKRILHIVRTHRKANGKFVRTHFRGLREFSWNGYYVQIGLPGKHFAALSDFTLAGFDDGREDGATAVEVGNRLAERAYS